MKSMKINEIPSKIYVTRLYIESGPACPISNVSIRQKCRLIGGHRRVREQNQKINLWLHCITLL